MLTHLAFSMSTSLDRPSASRESNHVLNDALSLARDSIYLSYREYMYIHYMQTDQGRQIILSPSRVIISPSREIIISLPRYIYVLAAK